MVTVERAFSSNTTGGLWVWRNTLLTNTSATTFAAGIS